MEEQKLNEIKTAEIEAKKEIDIPLGYVPIELSTKGLYGSPKIFHVRNAKSDDALLLSLQDEEQVPFKLPAFFNNLIYEEDVVIEEFTQKEVREFLIKFLQAFYTDTIEDMYEPMDDETWEQLKKYMPPTQFEQTKKDIEAGNIVPKFKVNLDDIQYYEVTPEKAKTRLRIKDEKTKLNCLFGIPRFGDIVVAKALIDKLFKEEDKRYAKNLEVLQMRNKMKETLTKEGRYEDLARLPNIPKEQKEEVQEYAERKARVSLNVLRAIRLLEWDGEDVSKKSIEERLQIIDDPRISFTLCKQMDKHFDELEYSYNPIVPVLYPFCSQPIKRRLSFRLAGFFEVISSQDNSTSSFEFE